MLHALVAGLRKSQYVTAAHHQMVAEAYLGGMVVVLGVSGTMLFVAAFGMGSGDSATSVRHSIVSNRTYEVSAQRDWMQIAAGEWKWAQAADGHMRPSMGGEASPAGLAVLACVLAYCLVLLLVGCYASYSCTPLGGRAHLFLHPNALLCANWIITFVVPDSVAFTFARCSQDMMRLIIPLVGLFVASFHDKMIPRGWPRSVSYVSLLLFHLVPLLPLWLVSETPASVHYLPLVWCFAGILSAFFDIYSTRPPKHAEQSLSTGNNNQGNEVVNTDTSDTPKAGARAQLARHRSWFAPAGGTNTALQLASMQKLFTIEEGYKRA